MRQVRAFTERHELTLSIDVVSGPARRFLLSNHVAINGDDGAAIAHIERK